MMQGLGEQQSLQSSLSPSRPGGADGGVSGPRAASAGVHRIEVAIVALADGSIVLPRAAIVETTTVLSYRREASSGMAATQNWQAPDLTWKGQRVPVIDPMVLVDPAREPVAASKPGARFVVLVGTEAPERLPHYALIVRGTPHPVSITRDRIDALDDFDATPWVWKVRAAGVEAHLLRLDTCEQRLLAAL